MTSRMVRLRSVLMSQLAVDRRPRLSDGLSFPAGVAADAAGSGRGAWTQTSMSVRVLR